MNDRNDVNIVEKHVEKGILALSFLLLVYALIYWGFSSPNEVDGVGPDQIDKNLLADANRTQRRMKTAKPSDGSLQPYAKQLDELQKSPLCHPMIDFVAGRPPREGKIGPIVRDFVSVEQLKSLMPAPNQPLVWAGYQVPMIEKPADIPSSHIASLYPWAKLEKNWTKRLRHTRIKLDLVAFAVRVMVQEVFPDGSTGKSKILDAIVRKPKDLATGTTSERTRTTRGRMDPAMMPDPGLFVTARTARRAPAARRRTIAPARSSTIGQEMPKIPDYNGNNADEIERVIAKIKSYFQGQILQPFYWDVRSTCGTQWTDWTQNLPKYFQPLLEVRLSQQIMDGQVLTWFHHDKLESGKKYRYKIQVVMTNPLLTHDKEVNPEKPDDAKTKTLESPWSQWSQVVSIPRTTRFLLTGSNPYKNRVRFTVITRTLGRDVECHFNVSPGQAIGSPRTIKTENLYTNEPEKRAVDFSTGAIMVDVDFKRFIFSRGRLTKRVVVLYMDDKQQLDSRIDAIDKEQYRQFRKSIQELNPTPTRDENRRTPRRTVPNVRDPRAPAGPQPPMMPGLFPQPKRGTTPKKTR